MIARSSHPRRRLARLLVAAALAVAAFGIVRALGAGAGSSSAPPPPAAARLAARRVPGAAGVARPVAPSLARAVGRKIMTGMAGTTPSRSLRARVRRGEVGGVILFGPNVGPRLRAAIATLQAAARAGANPPLVIAVDQEGGDVRRLPTAPPSRPPAQMPAGDAGAQGAATARALARLGINTDLAPVADVDHGSFLGSRSFGSDPGAVAEAACAFAGGLQSAGVNATLKHFPGLGRAARNTDLEPVTVAAPSASLLADLAPYRSCGAQVRLVMVSNATYAALDPRRPAVFSRRIVTDLLRGRLGFAGVTVSDTLGAPGVASSTTALRATRAGVDMLLYTDERVSALAYRNVLRAARAGRLSRAAIAASAARIAALVP